MTLTDKAKRGLEIYERLPGEFNIAGFFHYGHNGEPVIHYEELADWFDAKAELLKEAPIQPVMEPPPPHRDNLRDVLWAFGIIGLIAGALWLAGCSPPSAYKAASNNSPPLTITIHTQCVDY